MIYRLDFNSLQFFNRPTTSNNLITYAVDWSFLPENKKYKMTFSFISYKRPLTGFVGSVASNRIEVNFGTLFNQNVTGSNEITRKNNFVLGTWNIKQLTSTAHNNFLCILPHHNPPVFLHNRPSNNFITVTNLSNSNALTSFLNTDYLMSLYFEEIGEKIMRPVRKTCFKVNLNSKVYFSSKNPSTTTNRKYAIDWSFLDEYKKYKMTFDFLSQRRIEGTNALYDNWINQAGGYTASNLTIDVIEENNLTITQTANNGNIQLYNRTPGINKDIYKFIHIKYKVLAGNPDFFQLFYGVNTNTSEIRSVVFFYDKDNLTYRASGSNNIVSVPSEAVSVVNDENIVIDKFKYITFDMTNSAIWSSGTWSFFRLDPCQSTIGSQIQFEYFIISDSPNYPLYQPNGTADFDSNFINTVSLNLGNNKNYSGSSAIGRKQTKTAGIINISNSTGTETQQYAKPTHNPPTFLDDRPRDNFIEVDLLNFENTSDQTHADYLMNLFFEEC